MKNYWIERDKGYLASHGVVIGFSGHMDMGRIISRSQVLRAGDPVGSADFRHIQRSRTSVQEWIGVTLHETAEYNSIQMAFDLSPFLTDNAMISPEAKALAKPLPHDLFIWVDMIYRFGEHIEGDTEDIPGTRLYRLRSPRGQMGILSHGMVAIVFYFAGLTVISEGCDGI